MAFSANFKELHRSDSLEDVRHYFTVHGNQCERTKQKFHSNRKFMQADFCIIKAKSIDSFLEELNDGNEIIDDTMLCYKTKETDILYQLGPLVINSTDRGTVEISLLSETDGQMLFRSNKGLFSIVKLPNISQDSFDGIRWILRDPSIEKLELTSPGLDHSFQVLSWATYLKQIKITFPSFTQSFKVYSFARLDVLQELSVVGIVVKSREIEIRFFKAIETLPNLQKLEYKHSYTFTESQNLEYSCKLPAGYNCSSIGRLLNLWNTKSTVECSYELLGEYSEVFCRYIMSKVFSSMEDLTRLMFFWSFFEEKQHLTSQPWMRSNCPPVKENPYEVIANVPIRMPSIIEDDEIFDEPHILVRKPSNKPLIRFFKRFF